jgi:general secretion pathway protein L
MKAFAVVSEGFSRWIDSVAGTVIALHGWLAPARAVRLIEGATGEFAIPAGRRITDSIPAGQCIRIVGDKIINAVPAGMAENLAGSRIELVLRPDRFLFRPLELPGRAAEFLDGVVRSQIDRLTPWSAAEAAFGWSKPLEAGTDRCITTIAATALARIAPEVKALSAFGARSIAVFTLLPEAGAAPVRRARLRKRWLEQGLFSL